MDNELLEKARSVLEAGGLVAIPTETVYGLAADAENPEAVAKIYAAKKRPVNHPLIVHLASAEAVPSWAREVPEEARKLLDAFWPGPLTLVLKRSERAKDFITGGQDTVALRCPSQKDVHELLKRFDGGKHKGLAAPSANSFGKISPTTAEHVREDLGEKPKGKVDLILDGGPCTVGIESTILDLSSGTPRILREGAVTGDMIEAVLKEPVFHGAQAASPKVSGSLKSHYAPTHPLVISSAEELPGDAQFAARHFKKFCLIAPNPIEKRFRNLCAATRAYEPNNVKEFQSRLYQWMHELDHADSDLIFVVPPEKTQETLGIWDRLTRAAAHGGKHALF